MERWKIVPGTNGKIEISDKGRVRSNLRTEARILKQQKDAKGYMRVTVTIERQKRTFKVHREVAKAFIPNPNLFSQVNHIDGNKSNNCFENLEWVTNQQNAQHAIESGLWDTVIKGAQRENENRKKPLIARRVGGEPRDTRYFESVRAAERYLGSRHIVDVLKGRRTQVKGWSFAYAEGGDAQCRP